MSSEDNALDKFFKSSLKDLENYRERLKKQYSHFVFKDMLAHKDYSWYIQPIGFISSIVLFPSFIFCGMFTTIQESSLLDLQLALKENDRVNMATRLSRLKDINFKLTHTKMAIDFVERMTSKEFIKKLCKTNDSTTEDYLTTSMFYYKRYLSDAVGRELYFRNPWKYDTHFPTTSFFSKIIVSGISAAIIYLKFIPSIKSETNIINTKSTREFHKGSKNTMTSTFLAGKDIIKNRIRAVFFVTKYRSSLFRVVGLVNVVNVSYWGLETRK